jgi:DNA-binding response OmpR family regulator
MENEDILKGKKILIVDDEPDVLEILKAELDMCEVHSAPTFEAAKRFLGKYNYDAAILDIMGVRGYDLLRITSEKEIPTVMLTAHALSSDNLVKSIKEGAQAYVPKDKISDIRAFLTDMLEARQKGIEKHGDWFARLKPYFDHRFGSDWREKDKEFWRDFDKNYVVTKEELESIM